MAPRFPLKLKVAAPLETAAVVIDTPLLHSVRLETSPGLPPATLTVRPVKVTFVPLLLVN